MAKRSRKAAVVASDAEVAEAAGLARATHAERAAACELDLIQLFLSQQKHDIAQRRLQKLCEEFPHTEAATEGRRLLKAL